jgi:hypothetical protein
MFLSSIACLPRGCPSEETVRAGRPTAISLNVILEGARLPEMTGAIAGIGRGMRVLNIGSGCRGGQLSIEGKASI